MAFFVQFVNVSKGVNIFIFHQFEQQCDMKVSFFVCMKMVVISNNDTLKLRELIFHYFFMTNHMFALRSKSYFDL